MSGHLPILIAVVLSLGIVKPCSAQEWRFLGKVTATDSMFWSKPELTKSGYRRFWTKTNLPLADTATGEERKTAVGSRVILTECDCANGRYRLIEIVAYFVDGGNESFEAPAKWSFTPPGSMMDYIQEQLCRKKKAAKSPAE